MSANGGRFSESLSESTESIRGHLDDAPSAFTPDQSVNFIIKKVIDVLVPVIIVLGVLVAIFGLYKYFTSQDPSGLQDAMRLIIVGVV